MSLERLTARLDAVLHEAGNQVNRHQTLAVEHDERRMAHNIVAYVLERASTGVDPEALGAAMVQGAVIGEDESDGVLADPVVEFLESLLSGAEAALHERYGGESLTLDPVQHCVQYYLAHNKFPEDATPGCIAKAKGALAAGLSGSKSNKASMGTFL